MSKLKYISEDYIPKGNIKGFPLEVIDKMIEEQVAQGNKADVTVFERIRGWDKENGGFTWHHSKKGWHFWSDIMSRENFDKFFEEYPKHTHPKKEKALRYNQGKPKAQLPDPKCFMEEVKIHSMGAEKYESFNWKKGQSFLDALGSMKRHLNKFEQGINYDDDWDDAILDKYGLPHHLANIKWQADALLYQFYWARDNDDRQYKADQRIGLDIDGVLADFGAAFLERAVEMGLITEEEKNLPLVHWNDYRFRENFNTVTEEDEFWLNIKPIVEGGNLLFEPCVYITARNVDTEVTKEWLRKWGFPSAPVETVGMEQSKLDALKKHRVEIFVEDRYENWRDAMNVGVFSFLVTRDHNKKYDIPEYNRINCVSELKSFGK